MSGAILTLLGGGNAASAVTITVSSQFLFAFNFGSTASAAYELTSSGSTEYSENGTPAIVLESWCVPASEAPNYECFATLVSGGLSGGSAALNTWLALSTPRLWQVVQPSPGISTATINVGIRRIGTTNILASGDILLYAEYS